MIEGQAGYTQAAHCSCSTISLSPTMNRWPPTIHL
jgi:hypothetical protein